MDKAPVHLKPHSAAWFDGVMSVFELAPHHVHLLTLACDALDRGAQAREALSTNGITYIDARGFPKARPEVAIERDALDLSRFDSAPLIAFSATKETDYGTETNRRI